MKKYKEETPLEISNQLTLLNKSVSKWEYNILAYKLQSKVLFKQRILNKQESYISTKKTSAQNANQNKQNFLDTIYKIE